MAFPYKEIALSLVELPHLFLTIDTDRHAKFMENTGVFHPLCKFTVVPHSSDPELVHIRGANNKYLVVGSTGTSVLALSADKPKEDTADSYSQCTSFRAIRMGEPGRYTVKLVHFQRRREVMRVAGISYYRNCIGIGPNALMPLVCNIIDYTLLVKLPKRVAFKNIYGKLIAHRFTDKNNHNRFVEEDIGEDTVDYDIYEVANGDIQVRNRKTGMLWSNKSVWILSDTAGSSSDEQTMFKVLKLPKNRISLSSRYNGRFCSRWTNYYVKDGYASTVERPVEETYLEVIEPLIERRIKVELFRLGEARIYDDHILISYRATHTNRSDIPYDHTFDFSETVEDISSWSTSQTVTSGYKFSFTAGVPKIGLGYQASIQAEHSAEYEWGEEVKTEQKIQASHTTTVPKKTMRTVKMIVKAATCDVPFTYTQADRYTNGDWEPSYIQDGIYRGSNAYGFYYESFDQPYSAAFDEDDPMSAHLVATESGVIDTTKITFAPPVLITEESDPDGANANLTVPPIDDPDRANAHLTVPPMDDPDRANAMP